MMTTEQQIVAVAEWMGWKKAHIAHAMPRGPIFSGVPERQMWRYKDSLWEEWQMPKYSTSLDAISEVEGKLTDIQWHDYKHNLQDVTDIALKEIPILPVIYTRQIICATASQRLEAICRTLWPERFK